MWSWFRSFTALLHSTSDPRPHSDQFFVFSSSSASVAGAAGAGPVSWLLYCCRRNTSTSHLWGFTVISSGTHVQRCVLLGGLVHTGGGVKDRPIYIPVTQYANRAWAVRGYCAVYLQFIRDLCVKYVILTRYVRRIRDTKVTHLWHIRGRSVKHTRTYVERSWKPKTLRRHLAKITHKCVRFA